MAKNTIDELVYPEHMFEPEDLLHFIELKPFSRDWNRMKVGDDSLHALQIMIMANPKHGDVVKRTGGLRKMRFSPDEWNSGSSSSMRICYVYFEEYHVVILASVYPKNRKDDLSDEEKRQIKRAIKRIELALSKGNYN